MSKDMRAEVARDRLHARVVGQLPLDQEVARRELTDEQRALRSTRPRNRRWRALEKYDAEIDRLATKLEEARGRFSEAESALQKAPENDAQALANWIAAGEKGERPASTLYERERERDAAALLIDAIRVELDKALERRVEHVRKNRKKMLDDVRKDVHAAQARIVAVLRQLPELRQALLNAREDMLWVAAYPERAPLWIGLTPTAVALGLQEPVRRTIGTKMMYQHTAIVALLEEDAATIASTFSVEQRQLLGERVPRDPDHGFAIWSDDAADADVSAWKQKQYERALELARQGADSHRLGAEVRDDRP